jgi:hypothetical protein
MREPRCDGPNRVRVVFAGATLSFGLPERATILNLAEEVGRLARVHHAKPIMVEVRQAARWR